jgi:hypothetical protein
MWADMKAWAAQEGPVHVAVARMLARSATAREEAAQAAETAGTETSSQTGRDVPAAKEEKLIAGGVSANAVATVADEERRAARKVAHLARLADEKASRHAQLTGMKQRLPSLAARLRRLWQDVGRARMSSSTMVHLRASATVEEQLKKAEMLLQFTEENLKPVEWHLMEAEVYLKSARGHRDANGACEGTTEVTSQGCCGIPACGGADQGAPRAGRPARSASQPYCQRGRRPPGRRASSASGSGLDARTPKGHGLEPPEAGVVPTGGARRQARMPSASA